jgi:hypothetical protein
VIGGCVVLFRRMHRYNERLAAITRAVGPLDVETLTQPIVVVPLRRLDQVGRKALRFALTMSPDVHVVQIRAEELDTDDLEAQWPRIVEAPLQRAGRKAPVLIVLRSPYRQFFQRFLTWLQEVTSTHPDRHVIVLLPELVHRRWYQFIVSHRVMRLKAQLLLHGGPHVSVMSTPWYPDERPADLEYRWFALRRRGATRPPNARDDLGRAAAVIPITERRVETAE